MENETKISNSTNVLHGVAIVLAIALLFGFVYVTKLQLRLEVQVLDVQSQARDQQIVNGVNQALGAPQAPQQSTGTVSKDQPENLPEGQN